MQPIHQEIIIAPYDLIFISGAMNLFRFAPSICDFPAINRIFQDLPDQRSVKQRSIAILPLYFANTMISQIPRNTIGSRIRIDILIKNDPDSFSFLLVDFQYSVL